jgi:sugar phosphate permease
VTPRPAQSGKSAQLSGVDASTSRAEPETQNEAPQTRWEDTAMIPERDPARVRGWYYGWNVVGLAILSQVAVSAMIIYSYALFLPVWSAELQAPISALQLQMLGMTAVCAFTGPVAGALGDRYPARRLIAAGLVAILLICLAVSFATSRWQLLVLYSLGAPLPLGLTTQIVLNGLIARWFVRRRGLALGLTAFGLGVSGVIFPPLVAALLPHVGWRLIWRAWALFIAVVALPLILLFVREQPTAREGLDYVGTADGAPPAAPHAGRSQAGSATLRQIAARPNFWLLVGTYLPMLMLSGAIMQNIAPFATSRGFSAQVAGTLLAVMAGAHLVATLVLGVLSDRFGNRGPFAGLAVVAALGAVFATFGQSLPMIVLGVAMVGLVGGLFTLLSAALALEFGAASVGRAFGLALAFSPLASAATVAVARLKETTGSYTPALLTLAALTLAGGLLALLIREKRGGHATPGEHEAALEDAPQPIA